MPSLVSEANRDRLLTVGWNNALSAALGIPMVIYATIALSTAAISDRAAFIGLVIIGSFY